VDPWVVKKDLRGRLMDVSRVELLFELCEQPRWCESGEGREEIGREGGGEGQEESVRHVFAVIPFMVYIELTERSYRHKLDQRLLCVLYWHKASILAFSKSSRNHNKFALHRWQTIPPWTNCSIEESENIQHGLCQRVPNELRIWKNRTVTMPTAKAC